MRSMKIYRIVEYLKRTEFYHDTYDIEDNSVEAILQNYDICDSFSDEELAELTQEVTKLALRNELREAVHIASNLESVGTMRMVELS